MSLQYDVRGIDSLQELKPGDHIRVPGSKLSKSHAYWHHMLVDCVWSDHELRVIHYTQGLAKVEVKDEILDVSSFKRSIEVLDYKHPLPQNATDYSPTEAIARARSRVGEADYALFSNNCEHFVNWAKIGVARSTQVDGAQAAASKVGVVTVLGAVILGLFSLFKR